MSFDLAQPILFYMLMAIRLVGTVSMTLYRREQLLLDVVVDVVGFLGCGTHLVFGLIKGDYVWVGIDVVCVTLWLRWAIRDWKRLRDHDDDDDEPRNRRRLRSWAKSWLPKPEVKTLPALQRITESTTYA